VLPGSAVNTIKVSTTTGLNNGDAVIYHKEVGTGIPGLIDGQTYFVIVKSSTEIQLAATHDDATATTPIPISLPGTGTSSSQSLTPTNATIPVIFFGHSDVTPSTLGDSIDLGYAHGFTTGQAVVYHDGGGTDIGGLASGQGYYAIVDPTPPDPLNLAPPPADPTPAHPLPP